MVVDVNVGGAVTSRASMSVVAVLTLLMAPKASEYDPDEVGVRKLGDVEVAPLAGGAEELRIRSGVGGSILAGRRVDQPAPAGTHPAKPPGRIAGHQRVIADGAGHDRARADSGIATDVCSGHHDGACADRATVPEDGRRDLPVLGAREIARRRDCTRKAIVREDRVRAYEHRVLHGDAVIDEGGVLDLGPVADRHALVHERIAPHDALRADAGSPADLGPAPDTAARPDRHLFL